jgi:hypothetical protein
MAKALIAERLAEHRRWPAHRGDYTRQEPAIVTRDPAATPRRLADRTAAVHAGGRIRRARPLLADRGGGRHVRGPH